MLYLVWQSESENAYYSKDYQKQYKTSYWDSEMVEGTTVRESLKEQLYDEIVRKALLYQKAVEDGYTLTKEEETACETKASEEWNAMSGEERKIMGVTKERLNGFTREKSLVEKYFSGMLQTYQVDEEAIKASIKPEEYKEIDIQTIGFSKFAYDEDGVGTKKSKEEDEMGLESLKELEQKAKTTEDFNLLLEEDSDLLETEEISIIPGKTACDKAIEQAAQKLKPGEASDVIETESGYYIVKVISNSESDGTVSSEAYKEEVAEEVKQAKYKQFDEYFETVKQDADIQTTGEWDDIIVGGTVIKEPWVSMAAK